MNANPDPLRPADTDEGPEPAAIGCPAVLAGVACWLALVLLAALLASAALRWLAAQP